MFIKKFGPPMERRIAGFDLLFAPANGENPVVV
jgi:hypothetical protein